MAAVGGDAGEFRPAHATQADVRIPIMLAIFLGDALAEAAASLRKALRIYENGRMVPLADRTRAALASLSAECCNRPAGPVQPSLDQPATPQHGRFW
jgi:hypothetical protein